MFNTNTKISFLKDNWSQDTDFTRFPFYTDSQDSISQENLKKILSTRLV